MRIQDIDSLRDVQLREITGGAGTFSAEAHKYLLECARQVRQLEDTITSFKALAEAATPGVEWMVSKRDLSVPSVKMTCILGSQAQVMTTRLAIRLAMEDAWQKPHRTIRVYTFCDSRVEENVPA